MSELTSEENKDIKEILPTKVFPRPNGPLIISGTDLELVDAEGKVVQVANRFSICRCGHTGKQPFCDGSHNRMNFKD